MMRNHTAVDLFKNISVFFKLKIGDYNQKRKIKIYLDKNLSGCFHKDKTYQHAAVPTL